LLTDSTESGFRRVSKSKQALKSSSDQNVPYQFGLSQSSSIALDEKYTHALLELHTPIWIVSPDIETVIFVNHSGEIVRDVLRLECFASGTDEQTLETIGSLVKQYVLIRLYLTSKEPIIIKTNH
jgi:hypothetical protein